MTDDPFPAAIRRRWRLFLSAEALFLLLSVALIWAGPPRWLLIPVSVLGTWLVFTLPICLLYLIGRPPVITLSPLIPSAECRAFRRELKARPRLSDEEFYAQFYAGSGIPKDIPARVRRYLAEINVLADRAVPADNLSLLDDELDLSDILLELQEEFGVRFREVDYAAVDGTLNNLIWLISGRLGEP
jgi:hypothetical protein